MYGIIVIVDVFDVPEWDINDDRCIKYLDQRGKTVASDIRNTVDDC